MKRNLFPLLTLACTLLIVSFQSLGQTVKEPTATPLEWSAPYAPFRIAGNLYYVGTYDLACYLITTSKGNILINTGLKNSASQIEANIKTLGFKLSDTRILLTTQAHFDHMGAMAALKKLTGAEVIVNSKEAEVMADGGRSDYALGGHESTYEQVKADRLLQDHELIKLGDMELMMLHHPGHTKGSSSFLFSVKDSLRSYRVLIANMPTIVTEKKFRDVNDYPKIEKDYAYTLKAMKELKFDVWLSSHASQFGLHKKRKQGDEYRPAAFTDKKGYDMMLSELEKQFLIKSKL